MARKARVQDINGIYYIHQCSAEGQQLFTGAEDRQKFMEILHRTRNNFAFSVEAFCLASDSAYHLVLQLQGSDISKIMKSLNIAYTIAIGHEGRLFRDRYKSRLIQEGLELQQVIAEIREQWDSSPWKAYCSMRDAPAQHTEADKSGAGCTTCIRTVDEAEARLKAIASAEGIAVSDLLKNKVLRNVVIRQYRKQSTLSLKALGQVFGGLSESSLCKILNNCSDKD